jgi:hypothetical protein
MIEWSIFWWPFGVAFTTRGILITLVLIIAWVWMIIDCTKRTFKENNEKIVWMFILVFGSWIGALAYFFLIKKYHPAGLVEQKTRKN